jgi:hypothetical protein
MKMKTTYFFAIVILLGFAFTASAQTDNTFQGEEAGTGNQGNFNSGFGKNALNQNTGNSNIAIGIDVLKIATGGFNCALGNASLASNTSGTLNSAFGTRTLLNNTTGSRNIAFGHRTLESNVEGSFNTAIGYSSLLFTTGSSNVALGYYSPRSLLTGDSNIFLGTETAINLLNGSNNVILGNRVSLDRGPSTPFIAGNDTNRSVIIADGTGAQRIFISKNGSTGINLGNNVIPLNCLDIRGGVAIGRNFTPDGISPGDVAPASGLIVEGKVGIGTATPGNKLEVTSGTTGNSGLRFTNLNSSFTNVPVQPGNKFLSVNASGDVVLQKVSNAVESNLLTSSANLMTSNVNGISDSANIVNSISNTITANNQLITTVNGVPSLPVNLPVSTDLSVTNELQSISQSGNTITLSQGGGSFTLPTFTDTDGQSLALSGNILSISNGNSVTLPPAQTLTQAGNTISLSQGGGTITLPPYTDTDGQSLALSGNTLSISNGNSVTLPPAQTLTQAGNTISLSQGGGSFTLPTFTDTDAQSLALSGNILSISNGNSVMLPPNVPQTISQSGNTITLSQGGGSVTLPTNTDTDQQTLSLTGNVLHISNGNSVVLPAHGPQSITQNGAIVTLSNGGGSITLQSSIVTAGNNVSVLGNGTAGTPYVVSSTDTSLYADNGNINPATTVNGNRVVSMNGSNIWFNSAANDARGKIYIGSTASYPTTTGNYKLFVEGGILTEKVKVALRSTANWADYVFEKNYDLMPLKNVEEYIAKHKHLPGIDSADELSKNGLDLAEMQSKHMAKIEELTLYIIEQNKAIEKNNKDIDELKRLVEKLTANED